VSGTVLWDVDTQIDFVEPGGKLYFDGAEKTKPAMARLVEAARAADIVHVASCDQHELSDPEISEEPDFDSTWPRTACSEPAVRRRSPRRSSSTRSRSRWCPCHRPP
jgi:nicotinamidase-related amidase